MNLKRWLSGFLAAALTVSVGAHALAVGPDQSPSGGERFPNRYVYEDFELSKISHPDKPANTRDAEVKYADGILDYTGSGRLGVPGVDAGAQGQGDRGQSYSWGSIAYGDCLYVSTLYSAMFSTMQLAPAVGHSYDPEMLQKVSDVLYRGDFFTEEDDGGNPRCALVKINVKTGEVSVLMSAALNGISGQFRNAVEYHGKLYFCGSPNGIPSIWEIDPQTDQCRQAYVDPAVAEDPSVILTAIKEKNLSIAIRGMTVFEDHLVISCVGPDANPYIAITNDPAAGFTKIASTWQEGTDNTVKGELLGYPACRLKDSIYGGHIWEMIPFHGRLYVSICTGTPENSPDGGKTMQSFAIIRGECPSGNVTSREAWTWTPVVGDKADGAAYPFGIDSQRTRAGACTMQVFKDHLYIGEYNDAEIGMLNMMFNLDLQFLADNLEQSVNLYRMDENETMELVVGNPTEQFPKSLSGLQSGFGEDKTVHENQYIWRMETFRDQLYVGTFDQSSLLYPIAQFSNGDILHMTPEEWQKQLDYLLELIRAILDGTAAGPNTVGGGYDLDLLAQLAQIQEELEQEPQNPDRSGMPSILRQDNTMDSLQELHRAMVLLPECLKQDENWTLQEQIAAKENLAKLMQEMMTCYQGLHNVPDFIRQIYELILNNESLGRIVNAARCLYYLSKAQQGFDMFVSDDGVHFDAITRDGLGDPYNQGLRALSFNDSLENPWLCVGTANPFFGTQVWRLEGEDLNRNPRYAIDAEKSSSGQIITAPAAEAGETVMLDTAAAAGYQMMNLKVRDAQGNVLPVSHANERYSFVMPASDVRATAFFTQFRDLTEGAYYMDAVEWATENRIAYGIFSDRFAPNGVSTRGQAVSFLWRASGCPVPESKENPFRDVSADAYYHDAVLWAWENGIAAGASDDMFQPDASCKRAEIVSFLWRAAGRPAVDQQNPFVDVAQDSYYADAVLWAVANGITWGTTEDTFTPDDDCVRGQVVAFLYRYFCD